MGLDGIEIILRAEELFDINITDEEASALNTVGEFYKLICIKLDVPPLPSPISPATLPRIT